MKNKKICVYTCITGNYDNLNEITPEVYEENIDYYCFTNNASIISNTWKIIPITDEKLNDAMLARKIKILGHEIINANYDISVWLDGSLNLNRKITDFISNECNIDDYDMACFKHSARNCAYKEAIACTQFMKDDPQIIKKQVEFLRKEGFPEEYGLYETGCFVKKNNSKKVRDTMELWFDILANYSKRDQLSIMYSIFKTGIKIKNIDLNIFNNEYFSWHNHYSINFDKYLVFFGDNNEKNNIELYYSGNYDIKENKYKAKFKVQNDTNYIKFTFAHTIGIYFSNLSIDANGLKKFFVPNVIETDNKNILLNGVYYIELFGEFKKGETINIDMDINTFSRIEYESLILHYDNKCKKSMKELNLVNFENNKLKRENIELINENMNLKEQMKYSENEMNMLQTKVEELNNKYESVINSKGWKLLEKLRKIKNRAGDKK